MIDLDALCAVLRGNPSPDSVAIAARLERAGRVAFGVEAIADAFRRDPVVVPDTALVVTGERHVAIVEGAEGVFVELHGDIVSRLWHVSDDAPGDVEPGLLVAFDIDLNQARGDVVFDPVDHPALAADGADSVRAAALRLNQLDHQSFRSRAFVLRAFGDAGRGGALIALQALGAPQRRPLSAYAVAAWTDGHSREARDKSRAHGNLASLHA